MQTNFPFFKWSTVRVLLSTLLFFASGAVGAQPMGNEWIDYSKPHFKLRIAEEGVFKISKVALDAVGFPSGINGTQYKMFFNGEEIPIYVSTTGAFGNNDFILFCGAGNNGKLDEILYNGKSNQANENISLYGDTATYFLTYSSSSNNLRFLDYPNNIPANPGTPLAWVWYTSKKNWQKEFAPGTSYGDVRNFYFTSDYHKGEGLMQGWISPISSNPIFYVPTKNLFAAAGVMASLRTASLSKSLENLHNLRVYLNGNQVADVSYGICDLAKISGTTAASNLNNDSTALSFQHYNYGSGSYDQFGISFYQLDYPRNTDLSNLSYFAFQLPPSSNNRYLEFTNFNGGATDPYLFCKTSKQMVRGVVSGSLLKFYIPPSLTQDTFALVSEASIKNVSNLKSVSLTNFSATANQGNYIIVTHPLLQQITNGHNYIDDYKTYRSSSAGGSYNVVVANVEELYDQFSYGTKYHPLALRNFFRFSHANWNIKPAYALLLGRGLLYQYQRLYDSAGLFTYPIVPGYGDPGSDNMLGVWTADRKLQIMIGRVSAWNAQEVGNYLEKLIAYENAVKPSANSTFETELWKKEVLHIAGSNDKALQDGVLLPNLNLAAPIIKDLHFGAALTTIAKNSTQNVSNISNAGVDSMINNGIGMITYHGHGSANGFDFNLNAPDNYNSKPRFPVFLAMACDVARIYNYTGNKTLSERFQDASSGGTIAYIASSSISFTNFHGLYMRIFYNSISKNNYGGTIGQHMKAAFDSFVVLYPPNPNSPNDEFFFGHVTSHVLQGDPALRMLHTPLADYHVNSASISTTPGNITTALDSFRLQVVAYNLGKAEADTVGVKVELTNPANTNTVSKTYQIVKLLNTDTMLLYLPIDKVNSIGVNKLKVTIDYDLSKPESNENNNVAVLDLFIYSDNLVPVYPYEFAIVGTQDVTLKASTLNPFKPVSQYRFQIDTTELFNSPLKLETTIISAGGVLSWKPTISYKDSTVYYWRTALDSTVNGTVQWSGSSFIYLANVPGGWNQSHYYQYKKDAFTALAYGPDRKFRFGQSIIPIRVRNAINALPFPMPQYDGSNINVNIGGIEYSRFGCAPFNGTLQIMVLDSNTLIPEANSPTGLYGARGTCSGNNRNTYSFEFGMDTYAGRDSARKLLDMIPNGKFILIRNNVYYPFFVPSFAQNWKDDENINGTGISLYHSLKNIGFSEIDSFDRLRTFMGIAKKGFNVAFTPQMYFSKGLEDSIDRTILVPGYDKQGLISSTIIGPALKWEQLKWRTSSLDTFKNTDSVRVEIYGLTSIATPTLLFSTANRDTSIAGIDAAQYPRLQLKWFLADAKVRSADQLDYWRVHYEPVPEAALNAVKHLVIKDSTYAGEQQFFSIAIENLTALPMDSMLVKYRIVNQNNISTPLAIKRYRPLPGKDTLHASIAFDPSNYPGINFLFIEANPDNDQPEQYHPNNLGYVPFKVIADDVDPLLDVTFDGVHILDGDIVSAKPLIKILLKDENKFLKLDDTALVNVYLRSPNDDFNQRKRISLDGSIAKFHPADLANKKNEAFIEFKPILLEDGIYELYVEGKDKSGNTAGSKGTDYRITFEVINKATITNLLNYPNPFSTSTAFLFELTGSEIPHQFKIQIMTVTGKVVKEITRQELGPLHIGRNITEYKWDGKDNFGQLLGNGVYLYRVVTSINGQELEHRTANNGGAAVDKYWKNGWGKMYIMR